MPVKDFWTYSGPNECVYPSPCGGCKTEIKEGENYISKTPTFEYFTGMSLYVCKDCFNESQNKKNRTKRK